jgi:uncharacterized protein
MFSIFINNFGRLRSGWRLLIFVLIYIALLFTIISAVRVLYVLLLNFGSALASSAYLDNVIYRIELLSVALLAGYLSTRFLEGLPWRALGLTLHRGWLRDLLLGSFVGLASQVLATAIATFAGGLRFAAPGRTMIFAVGQTLVLSAALFVLAALAEEALFRGYPLQTMTRARLAWFGILLTSLPFAAVHLRNPNVVAGFTFVNTALAGVWLAVAYLRTRSLWFPMGVHWSWNWTLGSVFGLPVSGITDIAPHPLLQGVDLGPAWLTGGSYGIEGGVACTITLIVSTIFIWRTNLITATEEMKDLTSHEVPVMKEPVSAVLREPESSA